MAKRLMNKARSAVYNALRNGKLRRKSCEICGADKAHAHHDDYARPLQIRWLCARHHFSWHAGERRQVLLRKVSVEGATFWRVAIPKIGRRDSRYRTFRSQTEAQQCFYVAKTKYDTYRSHQLARETHRLVWSRPKGKKL